MSYLETYVDHMNSQCENVEHNYLEKWTVEDINNNRNYCSFGDDGNYRNLCRNCQTCLLLLPIIKAQADEIDLLKTQVDEIKSLKTDMDEVRFYLRMR